MSLDKLTTTEGINSLWISYLFFFFKGWQKIDIEITNKQLNEFFFGSLVFPFLSAFSIFTPSIVLNSIHVNSIVLLVSTTNKITKQETKEVIIFYQCKSRTTHSGRIQACICKMILEHKNMMNISKYFSHIACHKKIVWIKHHYCSVVNMLEYIDKPHMYLSAILIHKLLL